MNYIENIKNLAHFTVKPKVKNTWVHLCDTCAYSNGTSVPIKVEAKELDYGTVWRFTIDRSGKDVVVEHCGPVERFLDAIESIAFGGLSVTVTS